MFASKDSMRNHLDDEMLSAYMDRALPASEMQRAQRHLAACAECRQRLESLQGVVQLLHALPAVEIPRSFVLRPADVQPARPSAVFVFLRAATVAVAMMLAVVLAGDLLLRQGMLGVPAAPAPMMERAAAPAPATLIAEAPAVTTQEAVLATQPAEAPAAKALVPPEQSPTEAPPATPEAGAVLERMAVPPTTTEGTTPAETPAHTPEMMAAGIEVTATPALPEGTLTPGVEVTLTAPAVALPQVAVAAASETPHPEELTATVQAKLAPLPTPAEGTPGASPSEVVIAPPVTSPDEVPAPPGAGGGGLGEGGGMGGAGGAGVAPGTQPMGTGAITGTVESEALPSPTMEEVTPIPTPTPTDTPAPATPTPQAVATPTPVPPAEASQAAPTPAAPQAQEPATAVAQRAMPAVPATPAAPEEAPVPAPGVTQSAGFFNEDTLFLIRLVEIALALIVVSLAGATWVVRPRA